MKDRFTTEEARGMLERVRATELDDISNLDQQLKSGEISESDYTVARKGALDKATKLREAVKNKVDTKYTELQKTGKTTIKGVTDKIDTSGMEKTPIDYDRGILKPANAKAASIGLPDSLGSRVKALKGISKQALKSAGPVASVLAAAISGNASAALPGEESGPEIGSSDYMLESGSMGDSERMRLAEEGKRILEEQSRGMETPDEQSLRRKQLEKLAGR